MLSDEYGGQILVGVKQSTEAVSENKVRLAYVAEDADSHIKDPFVAVCREKNIPITYIGTKQQLGRACGLHVSAACAVVLI